MCLALLAHGETLARDEMSQAPFSGGMNGMNRCILVMFQYVYVFLGEQFMAMSGSLFVGTVLCGFPYVHSASLWHLFMKLRDACNGLVCQRIWDPAISKHETIWISTVSGHQPNQSTSNTWRTSFTLNFNQLSSKYAVIMQ